MAAFVYTYEKAAVLSARYIANGAIADNRLLLVMSNSTADTDQDTQFIGGIGTLDEFDGLNYARKALANEAVSRDDPNDRGELSADNLVAGGTGWTAVGAGTRNIIGIVHFHFVTNDADSPLTLYDDSAAQLPFNGNGGDIGITWNVEGILQAT